jgi:hypothetical protein
MIRKTWFAAAIAATVGLSACGPKHSEGDASDRGMTNVDHIGGKEIEEAVRDFARKLSEKNAAGWPPHIIMSNDTPPKPQVVIRNLVNKTSLHVDTTDLKNELTNMLVEQNVVYIVGDTEAVMDERGYSNAVEAEGAAAEVGTEDASGLVLLGEITDDVIDDGDTRQHDYWFSLRLTDTKKSRIVLTTRTKMRRMRE